MFCSARLQASNVVASACPPERWRYRPHVGPRPFQISGFSWLDRCEKYTPEHEQGDIMNFHDKIVLVAGGTGGLGREVSMAFLEAGASVVATYRRAEEFAAVV